MAKQVIEIEISTYSSQVFNMNWLIPKIVEVLCGASVKIRRVQVKEVAK